MILKVAVPKCLGPVSNHLRERPARKVLGQRSELSRGPDFWRSRRPWGPEQLIKMATGQLPDAYGMRRQPPANGDTCETNNALDYRDPAGSVRTPRLGSCEVPMRRGRWTCSRRADIEELIAAYRHGATAAALAVQFQIHRTTVAALLQRQK